MGDRLAMKIKPKAMKFFDKEERELIQSIERGEWRSVPNLKKEIKKHMAYAKAHVRKTKRINIRLAEMDLQLIQHRAVEEGIPYQTLMASVLHKYAEGRLVSARA
jgi:predicted DNA binding CopG/RHH family protein